ncbi:MAG: flagellar motor switch protein FliM [Alphaproteobacteria bacterium]
MAEEQTTDPQDDGLSEEDRMAAEWAAMAEDEADGDGEGDGDGDGDEDGDGDGGDKNPAIGRSTRVLNQDEIDNLLGFDTDGDGSSEGGIKAIVNSALVSYERLPMLEVVFDRLVRMMSTSLRNFTSDNVEVSLDNITSVRFGDYLNSIPLPAMITVFNVEEWDNYGLVTVDSSLIYSIVDVLLGGRKGTATMRVEGRPYTTIERTLVDRMIRVVLADISAAFQPLDAVTFKFERLETNPRFATIARPANAAIMARFRVDMEDRGGRIELLLPYATLEPVRELLLQMFMGEKFGRDSIWEGHLASELWLTDLDIEAVLDQQEISLAQVLKWKVGSRLLLNCSPDSTVRLRCGDITMFTGTMGRRGRNVAIQIEDVWRRNDEGD